MKRLLSILFVISSSSYCFYNLSDAVSYARTQPESVAPENKNIMQPTFDRFFKNTSPSLFKRIITKNEIIKPYWSPYRFFEQLRAMTNSRIKKNAHQDFTEFIELQKEDTLVYCIGSLYGAFHTLVRILSHFEKEKIIDSDFTILTKHTYIVFTGNMISNTPYSLETLSLICELMKKNPDTVLYVKGTHENNEYWLNYALKKDFTYRTWYIDQREQLVSNFFKTLPVRISFTHTQKELISSKQRAAIDIISSNTLTGTLDSYPLALIKTESKLASYAFHSGAELVDFNYTAPIWSIFSAPIWLYKEAFNFFLDAYALVRIPKKIEDSHITVFNRDIRTSDPFKAGITYNLISGQTVDSPQFIQPTKDQILLFGSSMDLSRGHRRIGLYMKEGLLAAMRTVNNQGGIHNKLFQIAVLDDEYEADTSRAHIGYFRKEVNPIIISPVGSHTIAASLDLVKEKKIYILFTNTGSDLLRDPSLEYIINFRVGYAAEAEALTAYAATQFLGKSFGFFNQKGLSALDGAKIALKKRGIKTWVEAFHEPNSLQVSDAVHTIKKANPQIIGLFSVVPATIQFLKELGSEFLIDKKLIAFSPLATGDFKQFLKDNGLKVTFAQAVPDPQNSSLEIVREYRTALAKIGSLPSTYSLEGYIYGALSAELLKRIPGPFTPAALEKVISDIKPFNFKGLDIQYYPKKRQLANYLWLETANGQWIQQDVATL